MQGLALRVLALESLALSLVLLDLMPVKMQGLELPLALLNLLR